MRMRPLAIVVTSGMLALGLSGCFGNPVENIVEGVIEDQTGIDVETGGDGGSASIPDSWPGLPVPEGRITSALVVDSTFVLTILVDSEDEIERVIAELIGQGYSETARAEGDFNSVVLSSTEWSATFGWVADEETGGFLLNYGVVAVTN